MTWARYEALVRLVEAHETLALLAAMSSAGQLMARVMGGDVTPIAGGPAETRAERWARAVLQGDAWALRQRDWHRRGRPRDTPGQGTRGKAASAAETSAEGRKSSCRQGASPP